jgi:hypothetical protein
MPAGPIGAVWLEDSWPDTAWEAGSWSDGVVAELPEGLFSTARLDVVRTTDREDPIRTTEAV